MLAALTLFNIVVAPWGDGLVVLHHGTFLVGAAYIAWMLAVEHRHSV